MKHIFSISDNFESYSAFLSRSLAWVIFFSKAPRAAILAKPVILGILPSMSLILLS